MIRKWIKIVIYKYAQPVILHIIYNSTPISKYQFVLVKRSAYSCLKINKGKIQA